MKGKIIVFEGLDGCGKTTQIEELKKYLENKKIKYKFVKFPVYSNYTSKPIQEYLSGNLICDSYQISSFYATDRLYSYLTDWKKDYDEGTLILMDRYVYSNAIFQSTRFNNESDAMKYANWLKKYEFNYLGLPTPDITIFLDIKPSESQRLMSRRYDGDENKKDVHEKDVDFQLKCRQTALSLAKSKSWIKIEVSLNGKLRSIADISQEIIHNLKERGFVN